jgi:hypothetical protein
MRQPWLSFVILLFCAFSTSAQSQPIDDILQRSLAAYGGQARLADIVSLKLSGKITANGQTGQVERLFQAPDRLASRIVYAGGASEKRVLVGERGWRNGKPASVPEHLAMGLQLARQRLPLLFFENKASLIDQGERAQGGRRLRVLMLPIAEGVTLTAIIEADSGLILQTAGKLSLADGTNSDFTTLYGDWRRVEGYLVAMREDHFSLGTQTGISLFEKAEFNQAPPNDAFKP